MKFTGVFLLVCLVIFWAVSCMLQEPSPAPAPEISPEADGQKSEEFVYEDNPAGETTLPEGEKIPFLRHNTVEFPEQLKKWLENSRSTFLGQYKEYEGRTYILVTYGQKPSGGYTVKIVDLVLKDNVLTARVELKEPAPHEMVTQAFTYPYDLVSVDITGFPVNFSASGASDDIYELTGVDELKPIVAESEWIKVFRPYPGAVIEKSLLVEGVANIFEGTVNYRLLCQGKEILQSFTNAAMGSWQFFSFTIDLSSLQINSPAVDLELFGFSAKDGSEVFKVTIPLLVE